MQQQNVIVYIKFFKGVDPRWLDKLFRDLARRGIFPPFSGLLVMVDHKNLSYKGDVRYDGIKIGRFSREDKWKRIVEIERSFPTENSEDVCPRCGHRLIIDRDEKVCPNCLKIIKAI